MSLENNIRSRRIYLASSWRNKNQQELVKVLREAGHEVYDFKNPAPGQNGFAWSQLDPDWLNWTPEKYAEFLITHPVAAEGFAHDKAALEWCDTCILALPCGRSAHLELGYAAGQGKDTFVLLDEEKFEPELMYLLNTAIATSIEEIIDLMAVRNPVDIPRWHQENGGNFNTPGSHAIRLLREVVELCMAAGAQEKDIILHTKLEAIRQKNKSDFNENGNPDSLPDEWADCKILLDLFAHYSNIDRVNAVHTKVDILWNREWQADKDGVLWRPTTKNGSNLLETLAAQSPDQMVIKDEETASE